MLERNAFLEGHLVGIGKIRTDGSEEFRWLDKPIHNRIVSTGLDHLLTLNGNQTIIAEEVNDTDSRYSSYNPAMACYWITRGQNSSNANNRRCGALHFAAYGTSDDPTSFTDTALHAQVGGYTSTYRTGTGYMGTQITSYGHIKLRVSHTHAAPSEAKTVRELGWFYDIVGASPADYRMFSRVVLDFPYELAAGEQLITTYELSITLGNLSITHETNFFNLVDPNGRPLEYDKQVCIAHRRHGMYWDSEMNWNYITTGGLNGLTPDENAYNNGAYWRSAFGYMRPAYISGRNDVRRMLAYNGNSLHFNNDRADFNGFNYYNYYKANNNNDAGVYYDGASLPTSLRFTIKPYTWGSFYRDQILTVPSSWPNLSSETSYVDIKFMIFQGICVSFGYYALDPDTGEPTTTWVAQNYRKYGNKTLRITVRQSFSTVDTI